jgi:hypothetical protein
MLKELFEEFRDEIERQVKRNRKEIEQLLGITNGTLNTVPEEH